MFFRRYTYNRIRRSCYCHNSGLRMKCRTRCRLNSRICLRYRSNRRNRYCRSCRSCCGRWTCLRMTYRTFRRLRTRSCRRYKSNRRNRYCRSCRSYICHWKAIRMFRRSLRIRPGICMFPKHMFFRQNTGCRRPRNCTCLSHINSGTFRCSLCSRTDTGIRRRNNIFRLCTDCRNRRSAGCSC